MVVNRILDRSRIEPVHSDQPQDLSGLVEYLLSLRPRWMERGACIDHPEVDFFTKGEGAEARAICADCPVRMQCLEFALERPEPFGVWGGKSQRQLRRMRRLARESAA